MYPLFCNHHHPFSWEQETETETEEMTVPTPTPFGAVFWENEIHVPFYHGDTAYLTIKNLSAVESLPYNILFQKNEIPYVLNGELKPREEMNEKQYIYWDEFEVTPTGHIRIVPTTFVIRLICDEGDRKCKGYARLSKHEKAF